MRTGGDILIIDGVAIAFGQSLLGEGITHLSRNDVPTVARRQVSAIDGIGLQIGV